MKEDTAKCKLQSSRHVSVREAWFSGSQGEAKKYYEVYDSRIGPLYTTTDMDEAAAVRALLVGDVDAVCDRLSQIAGVSVGPKRTLGSSLASASTPILGNREGVGPEHAYVVTSAGEVYHHGLRVGAAPTPLEALVTIAFKHAVDNVLVPVQSQRYRNRTLRKVCPPDAAGDPDKARWEVIHRGRRIGALQETVEQARALADQHVLTLKEKREWGEDE